MTKTKNLQKVENLLNEKQTWGKEISVKNDFQNLMFKIDSKSKLNFQNTCKTL